MFNFEMNVCFNELLFKANCLFRILSVTRLNKLIKFPSNMLCKENVYLNGEQDTASGLCHRAKFLNEDIPIGSFVLYDEGRNYSVRAIRFPLSSIFDYSSVVSS